MPGILENKATTPTTTPAAAAEDLLTARTDTAAREAGHRGEDWTDPAFPRHGALWRAVAARVPDDDLSHDATHLRRVYAWSLRLAGEAGADPDLAGAAALVHDLVSIAKDAAERPMAGQLSARASVGLLRRAGYDADDAARITEAVRDSNWSAGRGPAGPLGRVLQDADRLDAIGALGIARTFACAQTLSDRGRRLLLHHHDDPLARTRPPKEDRFALDHFQTKLLRLAEGMHLPTARREAASRHRLMVEFLEALAGELCPCRATAP